MLLLPPMKVHSFSTLNPLDTSFKSTSGFWRLHSYKGWKYSFPHPFSHPWKLIHKLHEKTMWKMHTALRFKEGTLNVRLEWGRTSMHWWGKVGEDRTTLYTSNNPILSLPYATLRWSTFLAHLTSSSLIIEKGKNCLHSLEGKILYLY